MSDTIICGKYDNIINLKRYRDFNSYPDRIRISSINPNTLQAQEFEPMSTNGKKIFYKNKEVGCRQFFEDISTKTQQKLIVLTHTERSLLLNILVDFDVCILVLEELYPIFPNIKYYSNMRYTHSKLIKCLKKISKLKLKGKSLAHQVSTSHHFSIERALRFKTKLDSAFSFSYKGPYQEVFKLKEEREDRSIIAFDFNSMFIDCMKGVFIEPKKIRYIYFDKPLTNHKKLKKGLFLVTFFNPKKGFFRKFHPFKYTRLNKKNHFNLQDNQQIQILLFKNEIQYYQQFFERIEITEGFCSDVMIQHPLKARSLKFYSERIKHKRQNNQLQQSLSKFNLITMHSASNPKTKQKLFFATLPELVKYLEKTFMFNFPLMVSDKVKLSVMHNPSLFSFKKHINGKGYLLTVLNLDDHKSIFSLSAQILANSRLKVVKLIERFLRHPSVEICYSNVDSLHISIKRTEIKSFLSKYEQVISDRCGHLKIESITDKGYWFDIGRYWLFKEGEVRQFKNVIFNKVGNNTPFLKIRKISAMNTSYYLPYVQEKHLSIYHSFSYSKKIDCRKNDIDHVDYINFTRYDFSEIKNLNVADKSYDKEILKSKKVKVDLYNKIATE